MLLPFVIIVRFSSFYSFFVRGKAKPYYITYNYLSKESLHCHYKWYRVVYQWYHGIWTLCRQLVLLWYQVCNHSFGFMHHFFQFLTHYPISSLCASLNENTLAGATFFIFAASMLFEAHTAVWWPMTATSVFQNKFTKKN